MDKFNFNSIAEYAKEKGLTRNWVLKLIKAGKIKAFKVGKAYIIPIEALDGGRKTEI